MSITFDSEEQFTYIYRYINGAFSSTNYAASTAWDLFSDASQVGDCIYFGRQSPSWSFHDLKFNIGTALAATGITIVWEYMKESTTWTAIPSVTDGTNHFQNTGINTVAFDVPEKMAASSTTWNTNIRVGGSNKRGYFVRCRITAVSGITEGGRTQTDTVKFKDNTITATNETLTLASLQSASDTGGWTVRSGVGAVETVGKYTIIRPHLNFTGTTSFTETLKMIEMGETDYPVGWRSTAGIIKLGTENATGKGDNGCYLYMHNRVDYGYDFVYEFQAYASVVRRRYGLYGAFAIAGVFKFVDSTFISDQRLYISQFLDAGSEWTRSVYAVSDLLYLYSDNLAIDAFNTLNTWRGVLSGGINPAVFSNTDINSKFVKRYYASQIDLIDCINIKKSNITSHSPTAGEDRHVRIKYKINLQVLDEYNNPIENARVTLTDKNGTESFSVLTNSGGDIVEQLVTVYDKWWESPSWTLHEDDYNDFTITITKPGFELYKEVKTITEPIKKSIVLQIADINVDQETI